MKIISVLLLCSLIAFTISTSVTCNPGYNNGVSNAQQCLYATVHNFKTFPANNK